MLRYLFLDEGIDFALLCFSLLLALWTVVVIESEHVVVRPPIHLNWEDCSLEWQGLQSHLFNPWSEIESVDWWNGVVLLAWLELVVVLSRWIQPKEHCLGTENGRIIPRGLNVKLRDVVELVHEGGSARLVLLFLNVPVAQLITYHVLLSDSKGSDVVCELGLIVSVLGQVHDSLGSV